MGIKTKTTCKIWTKYRTKKTQAQRIRAFNKFVKQIKFRPASDWER